MKSGLVIFRFIRAFLIILFLVEITGCASKSFQFRDVEPVRYFNDIHPIPFPGSIQNDKFDYYANVLPQLPIVKNLDMSGNKNARDINSFDEVPASSWFFPRLGYENISPEELVVGPGEYGPPQPPITVIRVRKPNENPRLFVFDARQIYYLLKFDPPDYPNIATTSSFLVNRLFCAFTNMSDFSADNTLDMYVGEENKGYIKHHIIDFDDAFGTHAARHDQLWAGYNHWRYDKKLDIGGTNCSGLGKIKKLALEIGWLI